MAAGVKLVDIQRHLDKRSLKLARRPGHDKKDRIDAANKILAAKGKAPVCPPCSSPDGRSKGWRAAVPLVAGAGVAVAALVTLRAR